MDATFWETDGLHREGRMPVSQLHNIACSHLDGHGNQCRVQPNEPAS